MTFFNDYKTAWDFLDDHPIYRHPDCPFDDVFPVTLFSDSLEISVELVDDENEINDDKSKNVNLVTFLTSGKIYKDENDEIKFYHNWELDSNGLSFEDAIIELANKVREFYGDYVINSDGVITSFTIDENKL